MKLEILLGVLILGIMSCAHIEKPVAEKGVTVRGDQLSTPGSYPVTPNMTLADILLEGRN